MEKNIINAENAENGFLDITGVKKESDNAAPEQRENFMRHAADDVKENGDLSVKKDTAKKEDPDMTKPGKSVDADAKEIDTTSSAQVQTSEDRAGVDFEAEKEDREFLALIKGKYKEAYRRRTENIIRRRLKSRGARAENLSLSGLLDTEQVSECIPSPEKKEIGAFISEKNKSLSAEDSGRIAKTEKDSSFLRKRNSIDIQKNANRNRPRENGVGGSVGMVTGINVSALKGSEVLELLRRAESGEKIKFK